MQGGRAELQSQLAAEIDQQLAAYPAPGPGGTSRGGAGPFVRRACPTRSPAPRLADLAPDPVPRRVAFGQCRQGAVVERAGLREAIFR